MTKKELGRFSSKINATEILAKSNSLPETIRLPASKICLHWYCEIVKEIDDPKLVYSTCDAIAWHARMVKDERTMLIALAVCDDIQKGMFFTVPKELVSEL